MNKNTVTLHTYIRMYIVIQKCLMFNRIIEEHLVKFEVPESNENFTSKRMIAFKVKLNRCIYIAHTFAGAIRMHEDLPLEHLFS